MSIERSEDQARCGEQAEGEQAVTRVWRRLAAGLHTAAIGEAAPLCVSGADSMVRLVVQDCGVHPQPLGAMSEAQRRLGSWLVNYVASCVSVAVPGSGYCLALMSPQIGC